jgi:hypothetical protein
MLSRNNSFERSSDVNPDGENRHSSNSSHLDVVFSTMKHNEEIQDQQSLKTIIDASFSNEVNNKNTHQLRKSVSFHIPEATSENVSQPLDTSAMKRISSQVEPPTVIHNSDSAPDMTELDTEEEIVPSTSTKMKAKKGKVVIENELDINRYNIVKDVNHSDKTYIEVHRWDFSNPEIPLTADAILARETLLSSDELVKRYAAYQVKVEEFLKEKCELLKRNRNAKIELSYDTSKNFADRLMIDEGKTGLKENILDLLQQERKERHEEDQLIKGFIIKADKVYRFTQALNEMKDDQLVALTHRTVDYLKRAIDISGVEEEQHFREIVAKIYMDAKKSSDQFSPAQTLYEYYKLQRSKDKLQNMRPGMKKWCKQALYSISIRSSVRNGRYKREIPDILDAQKQRHDHLENKYYRESETRDNRHGKERYVLGKLIKNHQDYIEADATKGLPYKRIIKETEQVHSDLLKQLGASKDKHERRIISNKIKNIEKSLQVFKDIVQYNPEAIKTRYENAKNQIYLRASLEKFGHSKWKATLNDIASDLGLPVGTAGTILGALSLASI